MSHPTTDHSACTHCGFQPWHPVAALTACDAGLYDDGRFPGRLIISARTHFDHLDEMPAHQLAEFMADVQVASRVLRDLADVQRANVAVLRKLCPARACTSDPAPRNRCEYRPRAGGRRAEPLWPW